MNKSQDVYNLERFIPSTSVDTSRKSKKGGLSIIHSNVSNRIILSKAVQEYLSGLETVQVAYVDELLAISNYLGEEHINYTLSNSGSNKVLYNASLVREIIDQFSLCYSERTSRTFPIAHVVEDVVYIQMQESNNEEELSIEDEEMSNDTTN